jgi:hypothetical protein
MQGKRGAVAGVGVCRYFKGTKRLGVRLFLPIWTLAWVISASQSIAADLSPAKNVLILHSFTDRNIVNISASLESAIRSHIATPVNFQVEYLESERFDVKGYENNLSESLAQVYGGGKIDVVVVADYPALRFAVDHRDQIFPGVPIVFIGVATSRLERRQLWPGVTGVHFKLKCPRHYRSSSTSPSRCKKCRSGRWRLRV